VELAGRHVLVTGASRGIGAALAERFAARGARLTLVARSADALEAVAARTGGAAVVADLADRPALEAVVPAAERRWGPVDVLVNNAGIDAVGALERMTAEELDRVLLLNLRAPMELTRRVLPGMRARRRGHVVNVSSLAGVACVPGIAAYGATKAGLTHFTAALRLDLRGSGVGTTVVEVGIVDGTDLTGSAMSYAPFAAGWNRFLRLGLLTNTDRGRLCDAVVRAVEGDRRHVRLPRRGAPLTMLPEASRRVAELLQRGVPTGFETGRRAGGAPRT